MKVSKAEVARRVDEVALLRLEGAQQQDVVRHAAEKGWGLQPHQVEKYIRRADALLIAARGRNLKHMIGLHLARREEIYRRAVEAKELRLALAALDSDAKLAGLYPNDDFKRLMKQMSQCANRIDELGQRLRDHQAASAEMPLVSPQTHSVDGRVSGGYEVPARPRKVA